MGEHKYNPTAIAAKNGELPPKEKPRLSKRQRDALIMAEIERLTGGDLIRSYLSGGYYGGR